MHLIYICIYKKIKCIVINFFIFLLFCIFCIQYYYISIIIIIIIIYSINIIIIIKFCVGHAWGVTNNYVGCYIIIIIIQMALL